MCYAGSRIMITYDEVKRVWDGSSPEIQMFAYWLYGFKPVFNCAVEIGVSSGASSGVWQRFLAPDGIFIGVDIDLYDPTQGLYAPMKKTIQKFKNDSRMNFVIADSKAPETIGKVKDLLGNKQVDFLYIDGEHSLEGTKMDYEIYSPLVAEGGIIAFHDATRNGNVRRAIESIIAVYDLRYNNLGFEHICRFDSRIGHCGIFAMVKVIL